MFHAGWKQRRASYLQEPANYEFSYEVEASEYGTVFGQEETRQYENARGSYHVLLPDGRTQIVEYEADQEGYKPHIRYEATAGARESGHYWRPNSNERTNRAIRLMYNINVNCKFGQARKKNYMKSLNVRVINGRKTITFIVCDS